MIAKKIRAMKVFAVVLAIIGILLWVLAISMWNLDGKGFGHLFPRPDAVHWGFAMVGSLYLVIAAAMGALIKNRKKMVEETDERNQMITAVSSYVAFIVQMLLLASSIFLLLFMGYLSHVAMFTLLFVVLISGLVFFVCWVYFKHKI